MLFCRTCYKNKRKNFVQQLGICTPLTTTTTTKGHENALCLIHYNIKGLQKVGKSYDALYLLVYGKNYYHIHFWKGCLKFPNCLNYYFTLARLFICSVFPTEFHSKLQFWKVCLKLLFKMFRAINKQDFLEKQKEAYDLQCLSFPCLLNPSVSSIELFVF